MLAKRLEKGSLAPTTGGATQEQADLKQANALYSLLEDRYKNKVGTLPTLRHTAGCGHRPSSGWD